MPHFTRPTILMCPPDHYGIEYEINPWMSRSHKSDAEIARRQWLGLKALLESLGADIKLLEAIPESDWFSFCAVARVHAS